MTAGMDTVRAAVAGTAQWHEDSGVFVRLAALRAALAEHEHLRALLREARESWIKVGYGASHEDVAECRDFCDRVDAALREGK